MLKCLHDLNLKSEIKAKTDSISGLRKNFNSLSFCRI